jgi:cytoskeletal protein CcmA (bactofilin family)
MRISGSGHIDGGKIEDDLIVSGFARIKDNFECNNLHASGSLNGPGGFIVHGDIKSAGSFHIGGSLQGDNDAKFSGSASIGQEINVKGILNTSGTFRAGDNVYALSGLSSSGSARITGDIFSEKEINLMGSARVSGNIQGENVFIGIRSYSLGKRVFGKKFYPFRIYGSIKAKTNVELLRARVVGDIISRNVKIDEYCYIKGNISYVDTIEIHPKAKVLMRPVQISEEELDKIKLEMTKDNLK